MPNANLPKLGRPKGSKNRLSHDIRAVAREYGPEAVEKLAAIMRKSDDKAAAFAADKLLDRAYGKPAQPHDGDGNGNPIRAKIEVEFVKARLANSVS